MIYNKPNLSPNQFVLYAIKRIYNTTYIKSTESGDTPAPVVDHEFTNAYIPITFYDGQVSSKFSTYDENLSIKSNSQYSLSFSVAKYLNNEINPYFYLIVENRRLRLQLPSKMIDFIITGITPQLTDNNIVYNVTCQDTFSYDMSKQNISISIKPEVPLNIADLANLVLNTAGMANKWQIDPTLEKDYYADFPTLQQLTIGNNLTTHRMRATMEINGSTVYNALVEICKKFNANLDIEYSTKDHEPGVIYFKNQLNNQFDGYSLRREVNLSALSVNRKTDSFCSIMHVKGGDNADGDRISISPDIPLELQKYFIMLYPHKTTTVEEIDKLKKTNSYPYLVQQNMATGGNYVLWYRPEGGTIFSPLDNDYTPWTEMTSAQIQTSFEIFPNSIFTKPEDRKKTPMFTTAFSSTVVDYFNFLKYRAKSASSMFYNFDYYYNAGLMDTETYRLIEKTFSQDLRNVNIILNCVTYQYNALNSTLVDMEAMEEEDMAQLAALDEEQYTYLLYPDKTPQTVFDIDQSAEPGSLNKTTILATIAHERTGVLDHLLNKVWTDEYFRTLLTVKGPEAMELKMNDVAVKLNKQQEKFDNNYIAAKELLDKEAFPGTMTTKVMNVNLHGTYVKYGGSCTLSDGSDIKFLIEIDPESLVYNLFFSNAVISGGSNANSIIYSNAVLQTNLKQQKNMTWPDEHDTELTFATFQGDVSPLTPGASYTDFKMTIYARPATSIKNETTIYTINPKIATIVEDRETYLADIDKTVYSNYATFKKKYKDALTYIQEEPRMTDPNIQLPADVPYELLVRKGLYAMYYHYLQEMTDAQTGYRYPYLEAKRKYSSPFNLLAWLNSSRAEQQALLQYIYTEFGDFIAETSFSDDKQLSSEGLFMSAMQAFSKYNLPSFEYSTTIINTSAIENIAEKAVEVNDIVNLYDKKLSSQYAGRIIVTIPKQSIGNIYLLEDDSFVYLTVDEALRRTDVKQQITTGDEKLHFLQNACKIYCRKNDENKYQYIYHEEKNDDGTITEYTKDLTVYPREDAITLTVSKVEDCDDCVQVYLKCSYALATNIMMTKGSLDTLELYPTIELKEGKDAVSNVSVYTNILNIELEENTKPIPLQVTGITRKLRDGTTQLTVSTDRTMDIIFSRLVKQARL